MMQKRAWRRFWLLFVLAVVVAIFGVGLSDSSLKSKDKDMHDCLCGDCTDKQPQDADKESTKKSKLKKMEGKSTFSCAINCMDGRTQEPVARYIKKSYGVDYVDMVTEAGADKVLADNSNKPIVENIKKRLEISVHHHGTKVVALVGHSGCAGNPVSKEEHLEHLRRAKKTVESFGLGVEVILLWVPEGWQEAQLVK